MERLTLASLQSRGLQVEDDLKNELQTVLNTVLGPDATKDEVRSFVRSALAGSEFQAGQETQAAFILRSVIEKLKREAPGSDGSNEALHVEASVREDTHTPVHVISPSLPSAPTTVPNGIIEDEEGDEERDDGVVGGGIDGDIDDEDMHRDIDDQDMHRVDDRARSWHARPINPCSHSPDAMASSDDGDAPGISPLRPDSPTDSRLGDEESEDDEDRRIVNDTRSGLQVFPEYYTKGPHTPKMEMDYSDEEVPSGRASPAPREIHVSARKVVSPRKALGPSTAETPQSTAEKSSHYGHECTSLSPMSSSGRVLNKSIDVLALEEQLQQCTRQMEVDHETIEALGAKLAEAELSC